MRNLSGPPVSGDDFVFRDREVSYAEKMLLDGNSVLLFGLRRLGKTSVLHEVKRRIEAAGKGHCCLLDVQDHESASQFFLELLNALPKASRSSLDAWFGQAKTLPNRIWSTIQKRVTKGSFGGASIELDKELVDYWQPLAEAIERTIPQIRPPVILLIDELPFFLENLRDRDYTLPQINQILATLRAWRNAGIPMAIAGSISIDQLLEDLGLSNLLLNNVSRLELRPLKRAEAEAFLQQLVVSEKLRNWTPDTIRHVLDRLDDLFPFFIQCAFSHLRVEDRGDAAYVDGVFHDNIEPDLHRAFFSQFDDRLQRRFDGNDRQAAERVMNALVRAEADRLTLDEVDRALEGTGADRGALLRRLTLQQFLAPVSGSADYAFAFNLIRRWRLARGA